MTSNARIRIAPLLLLAGSLGPVGCGGLTQDDYTEHVAFTPDGEIVVALAGTTVVLDAPTTGIVRTIATPPGGERYVPVSRGNALSADGKRFACAGADNVVSVFATDTGETLATITADAVGPATMVPNLLTAVALDAGGARLAGVTGGSRTIPGHLRVWDATTGSLVLDVAHDPARTATGDWPGGVALSPDGATLYGVERVDGQTDDHAPAFLDAWRVADGTRLWDVPIPTGLAFPFPQYQLALSSDGTLLAGGDGFDQQSIYVWRTSDGAMQSTIPLPSIPPGYPPESIGGGIVDVRFLPDASGLLLGANGLYVVALDGTLLRTLEADPAANQAPTITSVAVSPDGARLAAVGGPLLEVWSATDGSVLGERFFRGRVE